MVGLVEKLLFLSWGVATAGVVPVMITRRWRWKSGRKSFEIEGRVGLETQRVRKFEQGGGRSKG